MTLGEFYQAAENFDIPIIIYSAVIILIAVILGFISGEDKEKQKPWNYIYSVVIYMITVPGIFQAIISGYLLFVERQSLMNLNLAVYIAPILSMIITLIIISRNANLKSIPGFNRLSGLMLMIGVSIVLVIIISKTNIWLFFGGSMYLFFGMIIGLFILIKWGSHKLFKKKE